MGDSKYGRLFTEQDVVAILFARGADQDEACEWLKGVQATFPADEPLFLLRGQDSAAVEPLMRYVHLAEAYGAADEWGDRARAAIDRMYEWQQAHPDRVKVPD